MENQLFNKETSAFSAQMYTSFTEWRNRSTKPGIIVARKFEGAAIYPFIAVVALIETVARVVLLPLSLLPMLVKNRADRSAHYQKVIRPIAWGVSVNLCYTILSIGSFATNMFVDTVDPLALVSRLTFWIP